MVRVPVQNWSPIKALQASRFGDQTLYGSVDRRRRIVKATPLDGLDFTCVGERSTRDATEKAGVEMLVGRLLIVSPNPMHIEVDQVIKLELERSTFFYYLSAGRGNQRPVDSLDMATGLEPFLELAVVDKSNLIARLRQNDRAGGHVSRHEVGPGKDVTWLFEQ